MVSQLCLKGTHWGCRGDVVPARVSKLSLKGGHWGVMPAKPLLGSANTVWC